MAIGRGSKWVGGVAGLLGLFLAAGIDLAQAQDRLFAHVGVLVRKEFDESRHAGCADLPGRPAYLGESAPAFQRVDHDRDGVLELRPHELSHGPGTLAQQGGAQVTGPGVRTVHPGHGGGQITLRGDGRGSRFADVTVDGSLMARARSTMLVPAMG